MRLEAVQVKNFKGFSQSVRFPIADITLLYGPNSAGKSSMLQVLLLMKQTLLQGLIGESELEFRGPLVDLGGFGASISGHRTSLPLEITLDFSGASERRNALNFGSNRRFAFRFEWNVDSRSTILSQIALSDLRGRQRVVFARRADSTDMYLATESSSRVLMERWSAKRSNTEGVIEPSAPDISWVRGWLRKTPVQLIGWLPVWSPRELGYGRPGRPIGGSLESPRRQLLQRVIFDWQTWVYDAATHLSNALEDIVYVGPLRDAPRRIHIEGGNVAEGMGTRGERAAQLLARDKKLRWRVNAALEMLEIPYEVVSEEIGTSSVLSAIGEISALVLKDRRSGLMVTPGDVGFGISQILPVVLQLLLSSNSTICIEQPEVHLHPRLQSRLADVIVASSQLRRNQVIIETHSEHLLLRLQRRMRSGPLKNSMLSVLFVDRGEEGSSVTPVAIDEMGQLMTAWPDGFFDERLEDLLAVDGPLELDSRLGD